jgi:dihydrodipicolinate synthase/N-acetylneuraminate lyase
MTTFDWRQILRAGVVIPAHPLALTAARTLDERRQRALTRYYAAAGAGGVAVGVHTTQFAIRDPKIGLLKPVLELGAGACAGRDMIRVAGVCGRTAQAVSEAELAVSLGYHCGLVSLAAMAGESVAQMLDHVRQVARVIPVFGFYLQPAVGGRVLPYEFWRSFAEIDNVVAVKIAPFNRYQTIDVVRAVCDAGRAGEITLYTGNDDNILIDLVTCWNFGGITARIAGGLLGHWSVWTRRAVDHVAMAHAAVKAGAGANAGMLTLAQSITDSNAALFDAANAFRGCIAGLHEILRRQGLMAGRWCLDPHEDLSPGQMEEIDRVCRLYPDLRDDEFVQEHIDEWLT